MARQTRPIGYALVVAREVAAPRSRVLDAWTEREQLLHWWGPRELPCASFERELRQGGVYRSCLRSSHGTERWMRGVYREIRWLERLVFTHAWVDERGETGRETLVTVTFEDLAGRTRVTLRQGPFASAHERDAHERGWRVCFERMAAYLASGVSDAVA
jgi:uncharacterized protein YndB with AHSA1/START domain